MTPELTLAFDLNDCDVDVPAAEQGRLALAAPAGDERAAVEAIKANFRGIYAYCGRICRKWRCSIWLEEVIQDALVGALRAVRTWNPEAGANLNTYMTLCVRHAVWRELPAYMARHGAKVPKGQDAVNHNDNVKYVQAGTISAEQPIGKRSGNRMGDDYLTLRDFLESGRDVVEARRREEREVVDRCFEGMTGRSREVLGRLFGVAGYEQETGVALADRLGVSRQRVDQMKDKIIDWLREGVADRAAGGRN